MGSYDETKAALDSYKETVDAGTKAAADAYAALRSDYDAYKASHPDKPVAPAPNPTPGAAPFITVAGYKDFYKADFKSMPTAAPGVLPTPWKGHNGATNNGAKFRPENCQIVNGKGLVHTLSRVSLTSDLLSGAARANLHIPQYRIIVFKAYAVGFGPGSGHWQSAWQRGEDGVGEVDDLEMFAGNLNADGTVKSGRRVWGGGMISTASGTADYSVDTETGDYKPTKDAWNTPHIWRTDKTPGQYVLRMDGVIAKTIQTSAITQGANQFENKSRVYDYRWDFQGSGGSYTTVGKANAGDSCAGKITHNRLGNIGEWVIEWFQVLVPTG